MNEAFRTELDRYERELAARVGPSAASEARRELAAHLDADVAARVELGVPEAEAVVQARATLGDLGRVARAEAHSGFGGEAALLIAPVLLALEFFLPQAFPIRTHSLFVAAATAAILIAAGLRRRARFPWLWGLGGGGTLAMTTMLLVAMVDNWTESGTFALGHVAQGSWWDAWMAIPLFGLPPLLLYRLATVAADRARAVFDARFVGTTA